MFKYYISVLFHCFTQYYVNIKTYYELLYYLYKLLIFRCAVYKKGGVENPARMQECNRGFLLPLDRFAVHCLVRLDLSG